jgi:hypothetical protein
MAPQSDGTSDVKIGSRKGAKIAKKFGIQLCGLHPGGTGLRVKFSLFFVPRPMGTHPLKGEEFSNAAGSGGAPSPSVAARAGEG